MSGLASACVEHLGSHLALLRRPPAAASACEGLDAIIVPSGRSADHLRTAAELAAATNSSLLVLCSDLARARDAAARCAATHHGRSTVVALPDGYEHPWLLFAVDQHAHAGIDCYPDLSLKRNIGLLVARMVGWHRVFFLDDDIREIDPDHLLRLAGALGERCRAIGLHVEQHADNSVVCHAYRRSGGDQQTFVGANALLLETNGSLPFFPRIYNEDWFLLYDLLARGRVSRASSARQLPYEPFDHPDRAAAQEFGDVIGEGLLALLHRNATSHRRDPDFWARWLASRADLIGRTADTLADAGAEEHVAHAVLASLDAANAALATIVPGACTSFVAGWRSDLAGWEHTLARLPRSASVEMALGELGLTPVGL